MLAQETCLLDLILKGMSGMSSIDVMQSNQNNLIPYEILTTSVKSQRKKAKSVSPPANACRTDFVWWRNAGI